LAPLRRYESSIQSGKSWLTTILLALFTGGFGIDRFYSGRTGLGIGKLLSNILTCAIAGSIWGIIDIILLLTCKYRDGQGNYLEPAKRSHMVIALSIVAVGILVGVLAATAAIHDINSGVREMKLELRQP